MVFVLFAGVFFASSAPFAIPEIEVACGEAPLDVRFTSSATDVDRFLEACGPEGREAYQRMQVADLFYPVVFGVFMASSLALAISRLAPDRPALLGLATLPLVASGFDYVENAFAWAALLAFPEPAATNSLLGVASAAKTTTSWLAGVLLLVSMGLIAVGAVRRRVGRHRVPSLGLR
jgi:hypothetical protein